MEWTDWFELGWLGLAFGVVGWCASLLACVPACLHDCCACCASFLACVRVCMPARRKNSTIFFAFRCGFPIHFEQLLVGSTQEESFLCGFNHPTHATCGNGSPALAALGLWLFEVLDGFQLRNLGANRFLGWNGITRPIRSSQR